MWQSKSELKAEDGHLGGLNEDEDEDEDVHLGRLEADGAEEVFLFLCDCLPQKLNHLTVDRCCRLPGIENRKSEIRNEGNMRNMQGEEKEGCKKRRR